MWDLRRAARPSKLLLNEGCRLWKPIDMVICERLESSLKHVADEMRHKLVFAHEV